MGFLDVLSKAAPGINAVSGIAGGVVSALTGTHNQRKMARYQQKLQMELNEQQQKFARENAVMSIKSTLKLLFTLSIFNFRNFT